MDFDLFDAFFLEADLALVESAISAAAAAWSDSPGPVASLPAAVVAPAPVASPAAAQRSSSALGQLSAAPEPLSPSSNQSDSCGSGSDAGTPVADVPPSSAPSEPKAPYLPPCRVCNGPASGFHYGVNTCEACKGFFHRSLRRRSPYKCIKDCKCTVSHLSRSTCSACRYRQCLAVGMTKDAVKTGRYSHAKRTQDTLEIKRLQGEQTASLHLSTRPAAVTDQPPAATQRLCDSTDRLMDASSRALIGCLTSAFEQSFADVCALYKEPVKIDTLVRDTLYRYGAERVDYLMFSDPDELKRMLEVRDEVCSTSPPVSTCNALSGEGFSFNLVFMKRHVEKLEVMIRSIVSFAKSIPGYTSLSMHDQIVLIKASRAEVMHLVKYKQLNMDLSCLVDYDSVKNTINLVPISLMRGLWQDDEFYRQCWGNARRLQQLDLSISDVALLAAVTLTSPDREQLLEPERVHAIQETLVAALQWHCIMDRRDRCSDLPAANRFLATLLLHLPLLRTLNQRNMLLTQSMQQRYPVGLPPLVQEFLSTKQPNE